VRLTVYLIHLSQPVNAQRPARHYLGFTADLAARLADHRAGRGAHLLAAANTRGITYEISRTWAGGRALERRLKSRKDAPNICPTCSPERADRRAVYA
jgi:predicted GIY-YIG superfamily endonuclease